MDSLQGALLKTFKDGETWEDWLASHVHQQEGVWVKVAKKSSGIPTVTDEELVDISLCYGWISGQRRSFDESYFLQKYVPRRPKSLWSQVNVEKCAMLIAAGRMKPEGMAEINAAKADGRWDAAYAPQKTAEVPADLAAALAKNKKAADFFATLNSQNRYAAIFRITTAKTPEVRAKRLEKIMTILTEGKKFH